MGISITNIIFEYLQQNRRLTVPAFGTFLSKGEGEPLLFSEFMKEDDGVLRGLMVERGMSELEAAIMIDRFVFDLRHAATESERSVLPGLGYIVCEDGRNIQFEYDPEAAEAESVAAMEGETIEERETTPDIAVTEIVTEPEQPIEQQIEQSVEQPIEEPEEFEPYEPATSWQAEAKPAKRRTNHIGMILSILVLLGAILAMGYGILVQWKMGNVTFGEQMDEIIYNIFE